MPQSWLVPSGPRQNFAAADFSPFGFSVGFASFLSSLFFAFALAIGPPAEEATMNADARGNRSSPSVQIDRDDQSRPSMRLRTTTERS